jgi:plasmid stabilization system protein ParE
MSYIVHISEKADKDLDEISDYIAEHIGVEKSLEYYQKLRNKVLNVLCQFPNAFSKHGKHRYFIIDSYIAIYTVNEPLKKVRVIMFAHQRENYQKSLKDRI